MIPDRLIKDKPLDQQIGYYQAEETGAEEMRIARHNTDLNVKLTVELRNYLLHLSIISATIIGVVATLGREIIQGNLPGTIGFILLWVSLLGGVGLALLRTSHSIKLNEENYTKVSGGLRKQHDIMNELMLGEKSKEEAMAEMEKLKAAVPPRQKPKPLKEDWFVWFVFGTFALGATLVFAQALIIAPDTKGPTFRKHYEAGAPAPRFFNLPRK